MSPFRFDTQRNIVVATMTLHNYIRRNAYTDPAFQKYDSNLEFVSEDEYDNEDFQDFERLQNVTNKINLLQYVIANSLLASRN